MTTRLSLFIAAHALFTVSHSLSDAERHDNLRQRLVHTQQRMDALKQQLKTQRESILEQRETLQIDDAALDHRIDVVSENLDEIRAEVDENNEAMREKGEDVEQVLARLSDMEVAVGMPGSEVILEPSVELVKPSHTLTNCKSEFRTIDWDRHRVWAIDGIKRGWTCSRMGASLVRAGHVTDGQALAVCSTLFPHLPWADNTRRLQRWSRNGVDCSELAEKLKERARK